MEQSDKTAYDLYSKSAEQGNAYASYELGKMCRDGIGTKVNAKLSENHFRTAFDGFVAMDMEQAAISHWADAPGRCWNGSE